MIEQTEHKNVLNILHLLSFARYTGAAEPVLRLARAQLQSGHNVRMAINKRKRGNLKERLEQFGVPIDESLHLSAQAGPILQLKNLITLNRIYRKNKVHIIHSHRTNDHTLAAFLRPKSSSVSLIRTLHTERAQTRSRSWQLKRADGLIVTAKKYRERLLNQGYLDPERIVTISGAVNSEKFCPGGGGDNVRKEANIDMDTPVVGIVARMKKGRGHHWLLESWANVHEKLPDAILVIAGRGPYTEKLKAFVKESSWGKSVKFIGYRKDLPEVYRALNLKIILAPGNDGTCRAALEAMASGVPVLASDVGALEDIVENEKNGVSVPNNDRKALSDALIRLLSQPDKTAEMGAYARQTAKTKFAIENQLQIIENLYRRVLLR